MTSATAVESPPSSLSARALLKAGLTGGAVAAALNLALYGVARAAGVDFVAVYDPSAGPAVLPFLLPAVSSLVPSLFAALTLLGLSKLLARPAVPFAVLAAVLTVASMGGPANLAGAGVATKVALGVMHVIAALAITAPLWRAARGGPQSSRSR